MTGRRPVVAVVLAGGVGTRLQADRPKQLLPLGGRTVLELAVAAFTGHDRVDEVIVVMPASHVEESRRLLGADGARLRVIAGGVLRGDSTRVALAAIGDRDCDVLLHDGARPLVEAGVITDCVRALETHQAVAVAVPSTDTVAVVDEHDVVQSIPTRDQLRNLQTPQGFRLAMIRTAYDRADADRSEGASGAAPPTDDCGVLVRYCPEVPIQLVSGSLENLKITHPSDLIVVEAVLRSRPG